MSHVTKLVDERKSSVQCFGSTIGNNVKTVNAEAKANAEGLQKTLGTWNEEVGLGVDATTESCKLMRSGVESQTGEQIAELLNIQTDVESLVDEQLKKDIPLGP